MENSPMTPGILHFSRSLSIASGQTIFSKHLSSYSTHPYRKMPFIQQKRISGQNNQFY